MKDKNLISNNKRNLTFELLRIISMILIVAHHYSLYAFGSNNSFGINTFILDFLRSGGKYGIILFILITGYFSVNKTYERKKILKVFLHTEFYSYLFLLLAILLGQDITFKSLRLSLFPVIFSTYWFVSSYLVLYLLIPYLNLLIHKLSCKELVKLIFLLSIFITIIPSLTFSNFSIGKVGLLIYIYILGAFIRLNENLFSKKKRVDYNLAFRDKYKYVNKLSQDANKEVDGVIKEALLQNVVDVYQELIDLIDKGADFDKNHFVSLKEYACRELDKVRSLNHE